MHSNKYPTPRQIIRKLDLAIKRCIRQGKSILDIIKTREIKKLQTLYNKTSGYILNDYQLKRMVKFKSSKSKKLNQLK